MASIETAYWAVSSKSKMTPNGKKNLMNNRGVQTGGFSLGFGLNSPGGK
jgi:hypothetical protein